MIRDLDEKGVHMNFEEQLVELQEANRKDMLRLLKHLQLNTEEDLRPAIESYVKNQMLKVWQRIGSEQETRDASKLVEILWDEMGGEVGMEFSKTVTEEGIQIECTYCPFVELSKEHADADIGFSYYCSADPHIVKGFNPELKFERTQTLMEDHKICNHFYPFK